MERKKRKRKRIPAPIKRVTRLANRLAQLKVLQGNRIQGKAFSGRQIKKAIGITNYEYEMILYGCKLPDIEVREKLCNFLQVSEELMWPGIGDGKDENIL